MDIDFEEARRTVDEHLWLPLHVARRSAAKVRPEGDAAVHERYRRPPPSRRDGAERGTHRSPRGAHEGARRRDRAGFASTSSHLASSTHHCRREIVSAIDSTYAATSSARRCRSATRRPRERRRARRPSHDEHRPHGRNLRYRRRAAAGGGLRARRRSLKLASEQKNGDRDRSFPGDCAGIVEAFVGRGFDVVANSRKESIDRGHGLRSGRSRGRSHR